MEGASDDGSRQTSDNLQTAAKIKPGVRSVIEALVINPATVVGLGKIAGQEAAKDALQTALLVTVDFEAVAVRLDRDILCRGVPLHGPPGTGKTALALAVARERHCTVFRVNAWNLFERYLSDTLRNITALFAIADENRPSFKFLDECESICSRKDAESAGGSDNRLICSLLRSSMWRYPHVTVIGATDAPWQIDATFLRQFEEKVFVGLPDKVARKDLIEIQLSTRPHCLTPGDVDRLAEMSENLAGHTIVKIFGDVAVKGIVAARWATHFRLVSFYVEYTIMT